MEWSHPSPLWHCSTPDSPPAEFVRAVQQYATAGGNAWRGYFGIDSNETCLSYEDSSIHATTNRLLRLHLGAELQQAIARLQQAIAHGDAVAIWGDFDADGVTATSVLWEGLGQFFDRSRQLSYYIPNRLTESRA